MDDRDEEAISPLGELGKVEPDAEAARLAILRVRTAMLQQPETTTYRRVWILRVIASSAACLAVALILWMAFGALGTTTFAAMQSRVAGTHSVEFKMWDEDAPDEKITVRILESGLMRQDYSDGSYCVTDFSRRRVLNVEPESKEAHLVRGMSPRMQQNLYERIRSIPANAVEVMPASTINGKNVQVYRARLKLDGLNEEEFLVSVDAQTLLPVRMETRPIDSNDEPDRSFIADIRFNEVSADVSFSTDPPPGMSLAEVGLERLKDSPSEAALVDPELKPGFGIGQLKLGMTQKKVLNALGTPDQVDPDTGAMDYFSRGYSIGLDDRGRIDEIDCYTQESHDMEVRDFKGHTTEGIRMGANRAAIEKVYGNVESVEINANSVVLDYSMRGLEFFLKNDRLVRIVLTKASRPSRQH